MKYLINVGYETETFWTHRREDNIKVDILELCHKLSVGLNEGLFLLLYQILGFHKDRYIYVLLKRFCLRKNKYIIS